jgi:hypothetical protein
VLQTELDSFDFRNMIELNTEEYVYAVGYGKPSEERLKTQKTSRKGQIY